MLDGEETERVVALCGERERGNWGPYQKRDDAYRLFPGFGFYRNPKPAQT